MNECERNDPELKGLRHVDQLSEYLNDDTSSGSLDAVFTQKEVDAAQVREQMGQLAQSSEILEPEMARKIGKGNLRRSLAWDSAFFTSAGFLEPDELSSMMEGSDKHGKHLLDGIEEDMQKSIDSISTLGSESLTLESLEADFFEDIRASIQKSSKASNWTSSSKAAPAETDTLSICSLKKVDASKHMMKLKPASKKQTTAMHGPGKLAKQSSGSQGTQPLASKGGVTSTIPKPPKVIGRPNPILSAPLKRASLDPNKVKRENDKAKGPSVPCKVGLVSKVPGLGGPFRTVVPKPAPSSKSSSLSSANGGKGISPVKSSRRIDSNTINPVSSSSTLKNPSKVSLKKKGQAPLPLSKQTSNVSPASSFSEWSSVSSSSTSTVNERSNSSRVSIDTSSPCRSLESDAPPAFENHSQRHDQISIYEHKANPQSSENQQKASMQSVLSRPATGQPTSLRMPSPKLGFFDGVKPVDRIPKGSMQSHSGIPAHPKIGARISNPNGASSHANNTKLQPTRSVTATGNLKLDSKKPALPVPAQKPLNASPKISNVSGDVNKNHSISAKSHNHLDGESCLKAVKVVCEGPGEEKSKSPGLLTSESNLEKQDNSTKLKDSNFDPAEGDSFMSTHLNAGKIKQTENEGEHANLVIQQLGNEFNSLFKADEKEDVHFEDHVESMHVGAFVSKLEVQIELVGNSVSQIDPSHLDLELPSLKELSCPGEMGESPINLLGPTIISLSSTTSEINASARKPLAVKLKDSIAPAEGDAYVSFHFNAEKIKLAENENEYANFILQQLENELNSLCKANEKEDAHLGDHVEGLSMHAGAMVSKQDVQDELVGYSVSRIDSSHLDSQLPSLKEMSGLGGMGESSLSSTTSEINASARKPLAVKLKDSIAPAEGDAYVISHFTAEKIKLTENENEYANFILQQLESELNSLCKANEKEDAHLGDHVEGLSMHAGTMVSKQDVQDEIVGYSVSRIDSSHLDSQLPSLKEMSCLVEMGESPNNLLGSTLSNLSPTKSEINASARKPLAVKNSH